MGLERPCWTISFGLIYAALAVAAVIMHISVIQVVPAVESLPENLVEGMKTVFGFGTMEEKAIEIKMHAHEALGMCDEQKLGEFDAETTDDKVRDFCSYNEGNLCTKEDGGDPNCPSVGVLGEGPRDEPACSNVDAYGQQQPDTTEHKDAIVQAFLDGLAKIVKIAEDPYLGLDQFVQAGEVSKTIEKEAGEIEPETTSCCVQIPLYCALHKSGKELGGQVSTVNDQLEEIRNNKGVQDFKSYVTFLNLFHALPYIMVIAQVFYTILWYKNGAFCCCSGGSFLQFCCIILPQIVFWLLGFILMAVFTVFGYAVSIIFESTQIPDFPNTPTIQTLITHIETEYSDFWDIVFADLVGGLSFFRMATTIFVFVAIFMMFHACCFCCCRPYKLEEEGKAQG